MTSTAPSKRRDRRTLPALLALLGLLVAGALVWWALADDPVGAPDTDPDAARIAADDVDEPDEATPGPSRRRAHVAPPPAPAPTPDPDEEPSEVESANERGPGWWRVCDNSGLPVAGAEVRFLDAEGGELGRLTTDTSGAVAPGAVPAEARRLHVSATGCVAREVIVAEIPDRVVQLVGSGRIVGRVVDSDGRAVEDVDVKADVEADVGAPSFGDSSPLSHLLRCLTTGADGAFLLESVPPRALRVTATLAARPDRRPGTAQVVVPARTTDEVILRLDTWPIVTGRVLDAAGKPLAHAQVAMRGRRPDGSGGRVWSTSTDAEGRFSIDDVAPENTLWAWSNSHAELAMAVLTDVTPGGESLDVRLVPGGPLEARVVDASGHPYAGSGDFYVLDATGRLHNSASVHKGLVKTHVLPFDAPFDLLVQAPGGLFGRLDDVRAGARGLVVQLRPVATIRGRALSPDGSPAPVGTIVRAFSVRNSERIRSGIAIESRVAADGEFELRDLADLPFVVWAEPDGGEGDVAPSALVAGVQPGAHVTLSLRRAAPVSGRVEGAQSARTLIFYPDSDAPWSVRVVTAADGTFSVGTLPAGTYSVWSETPPNRLTLLGTVRAPSSSVVLQPLDR